MSKRIAIIDLEKDRCWLCPLFEDGADFVGDGFCRWTNRIVYNCNYIPDNCPLVPMPNKRGHYYAPDDYDDGWDDCIDAMGG